VEFKRVSERSGVGNIGGWRVYRCRIYSEGGNCDGRALSQPNSIACAHKSSASIFYSGDKIHYKNVCLARLRQHSSPYSYSRACVRASEWRAYVPVFGNRAQLGAGNWGECRRSAQFYAKCVSAGGSEMNPLQCIHSALNSRSSCARRFGIQTNASERSAFYVYFANQQAARDLNSREFFHFGPLKTHST
jgi:hypothetical protein